MAAEHGVGSVDDGGWGARVGALLEAEPLVATAEAAVAPMAGLAWPASDTTPAGTINIAAVRRVIAEARARMRQALQALGCPEYGEERALAIHLYTKEMHFRLYWVINDQMRRPNRSAGPGGVSAELRRCLPYIKYLLEALENAPPVLIFDGRCHRGVKFAYSALGTAATAADHDPAAYFHVGRQFLWYEFKSASRTFDTMYLPVFCGDRGPRTIFTIEGVKGVLIQAFSEQAGEEEVLFPPLRRFEVTNVQKKLMPQHLQAGVGPGGFPDEVHLVAPGALAEAVPRELKLRPGLEVIDFDAPPLGHGGFADVRPGTYAFDGAASAPTTVAFKIFRGSQTLPKAMVDMVLKEARLGVSQRVKSPLLSLCPVCSLLSPASACVCLQFPASIESCCCLDLCHHVDFGRFSTGSSTRISSSSWASSSTRATAWPSSSSWPTAARSAPF